jgi:hypothetical protein
LELSFPKIVLRHSCCAAEAEVWTLPRLKFNVPRRDISTPGPQFVKIADAATNFVTIPLPSNNGAFVLTGTLLHFGDEDPMSFDELQ